MTEHVFRPLAHLPVRVTDGLAEGRLHSVSLESVVETCQCDHGPAPDGRLVSEGPEHRHQPVRMTQSPERGYRSLPAQGVPVAGGEAAESGDNALTLLAVSELAKC